VESIYSSYTTYLFTIFLKNSLGISCFKYLDFLERIKKGNREEKYEQD